VHDDVIDHDTHRRGVPNITGEFRARARERGADASGAALLGDAAAIIAGDLLLHEASRLIALTDVPADARRRLLALLDDAVLVSAAGELADVENAVTGADVDAILAATRDKTAVYSFSAPLCAGAVLAGADAATEAALQRCGDALGLAFQLVDDLIGAFGSMEAAGRASGGDLREAKQTPLVALARDSEDWSRVNDALAVAHTGPIAVRDAQRALAASGAPARVVALVDTALADAVREADPLPEAARGLVAEAAAGIRERVP
jgi:geranylgeranyl diphosphate synthase type II